MVQPSRQADRTQRVTRPLADFVRWLLTISLITGGFVVAGMVWVQSCLDEEIRAYLERKIQANYPNLLVTIESAKRIEGLGITIRDLSISEVDHSDQTQLLASVGEIFVKCDANLAELARGKPHVRQVTFRRPVIYSRRRQDGSWNSQQLFPLPKFGDTPPPAVIQDGSFELIDTSGTVSRRLRLRNVELTLSPVRCTTTGNQGHQGQRVAVTSMATRAEGSFSSDHCKRAIIDAQFDVKSSAWSMQGSIEQLRLSPSLIAALPSEYASKLKAIDPARGTSNLTFKAAKLPGTAGNPRFQAKGVFAGRIEDPRLPRHLENVQADFYCDDRMMRIDKLVATSGQTQLEATYQLDGWLPTSRQILSLHAKKFVFDRSLNAALPDQWRVIWDKFQPAGLVDLDLLLHFNGSRWVPVLSADFIDMSFAYEQFPYRLMHCQGKMHFENEELVLDGLQARASGRRVSINGRIIRPGPDFTGWVEMSADEPLDIDEQLIEAMQDRTQDFIRSLHPHGEITAWGRLERNDPSQPATKRYDIGLRGCSINYDGFRYPIHKINGSLSVVNDEITLKNLQGYNDSGFISCQGQWKRDQRGGSALNLHFSCADVPLEDELRHALKPSVQKMWATLRPRGTIDRLEIDVEYATATGLAVAVMAQKRRREQNVAGRSITIRPDWFAYQLDDLIGTIYFKDGIIALKNLHARHGVTEVRLGGSVSTKQGRWRVQLENVHVNRLHTTHELCAALPPALGNALTKLNLTGPISMSGLIQLEGNTGTSSPQRAGWNLEFDVEDGNLACGLNFEHLRGGLTLLGNNQDGNVSSSGQLALDSLIFKGVQLSRVHGPLSIGSGRIVFGERAEVPQGTPPRRVYANVFDGKLAANAQVWYADNGRFELDLKMQDANLATISKEATTRQLDISGRTFADLYLEGNGHGMHALRGHGTVDLREADIYEFPILVDMLAFLSLKRPNGVAFNDSKMNFRVEADRLYFDRIDFAGDAISLYGRGEITDITDERKLNLIFDTSVGRDDNRFLSELVRPLLKEAGKRILVIYAGGSLDEPEVRRQPFPELNDTFQQVFPGQPPARGAAMSRLPRSGGVRRPSSPRR
ncbi:MAG: AsmA-like C-terminal region-containing protein [Pirellulaceae bacterium]|nr:AsmA-like C-terminal region-containing protein [Pirellulaceae bacterium]